MVPEELRQRTSEFADVVTELVRPFLKSDDCGKATKQVLRASTAVASNYRAACVARSPVEFASTIGLVLQEADECNYWLSYLLRHRFIKGATAEEVADEARQLAKIFGASFRTVKRNAAFWKRQHSRPSSARRKGGRSYDSRSQNSQ